MPRTDSKTEAKIVASQEHHIKLYKTLLTIDDSIQFRQDKT